MGISKIIEKLLSSDYLSEERAKESDYDLLYTLMKLREEKKRREEEKIHINKKAAEVDAFLTLLRDDEQSYSESELNYLYNEINNINNE